MPPGVTPPLILNYNASTVPIIQLALSGTGPVRAERCSTSASTSCARRWSPCRARRSRFRTAASRGRCRSTSTRRDAGARPVRPGRRQRARGAEPDHAGRHAEDRQLRIRDAAQQRARRRSPSSAICRSRRVNGAMVYMRDVAHVRDGNPPQTNIVHVDGSRSVLMSVLKNGAASTLAIIDGIKDKLSRAQGHPAGQPRRSSPIGDQSLFVSAAISGVHPRRRDRGGADQPDDPALPRQLALDRHHRDLDPALDPRLDRDPVRRSARRSTS